MIIKLYHGTNTKNADKILKEGFKDKVESNEKNWDGKIESQPGFIYLTRAYPFFYAMNAAKLVDTEASVLMVEVDSDDMYPDEDFLRENGLKNENINIREFSEYAHQSFLKLGNVAIEPSKIRKIIGKKNFKIDEMILFSDPSMSSMNYKILGSYYRELTDTWWEGGDWKKVDQMKSIIDSISKN